MKTAIEKALDRASADRDAGRAHWVPVFIDVILSGRKIGHITSDGFTNSSWRFYANDPKRRRGKSKPLDNVLPAWASGAVLQNPRTMRERMRDFSDHQNTRSN
jgi:hypothetical protein